MQCSKRAYRYPWEKPSFQPLKSLSQPHSGSILGSWTDGTTIFSVSDLKINDNGTFSYYFGGCTGTSYTEGSWTSIGNTLILTSYDKYKEEIPAEPAIIMEQESEDPAKYYLDHVMYRLVGDTLYELDNTTQLCNQTRYWRPRDYLLRTPYYDYLFPDQK